MSAPEPEPQLTTAIGHSTPDRIFVRGYDLADELMGEIDFGSMAFLLVAGRRPEPGEARLFNAMLVALADHGLTPSAIAARLTYLGAPEAMQGALAAGLLGAGSVFLGVFEDAARLLQEAGPDAGDDDTALRRTAAAVLDRLEADGRRLPGLGHPTHKAGDPRTSRLFALADEHGLTGPHTRLMVVLTDEANQRSGRKLPLNAAGACGALLSDLRFHWSVVRGFAVVARAAGLVGHIAEEVDKPLGRAVWQMTEEAVTYRPEEA